MVHFVLINWSLLMARRVPRSEYKQFAHNFHVYVACTYFVVVVSIICRLGLANDDEFDSDDEDGEKKEKKDDDEEEDETAMLGKW